MAGLFHLYISYSSDLFPFEWLQKTEDLKVRCRDSTREKVAFSISPELLHAIHKCERVTAPEKTQGLPSDWGFSGFMKTAAHQVLDEVPFTKAEEGTYLRDSHWSCMIRDRSSTVNTKLQETSSDYFLKSELLAVTSIFYRQMNEMVWLPEENRYMAKPIYKEGFLADCAIAESTHDRHIRLRESTHSPSDLRPIGNEPNAHLDAEGCIRPRQRQLRQKGSL
ncbi:hypothetical protein ACJ73_01492 [Blastomyces percursus]|uniref:Uncharacterized protein n=1 Tax=Blastomyces percursus TaxID=1658174 RepID=A0A1J9RGJ0_9EURO|nr:hypothetical protein ACJ73_01492 [Blastomyces percursus]